MFSIDSDGSNKDLFRGESRSKGRRRFLSVWDGFEGQVPVPPVKAFGNNRYVLRADLNPAGLKAYGAEKLIAQTRASTLVYVAPRVGHAPDAIAYLAKLYGKKCVFFCPAAARPSKHQAALLAYGNVELRFVRVAAMPVLNGIAKAWADQHGAVFLPLGLKDSPDVTAGLVHMAKVVAHEVGEDPTAVVCAVSTGTMIRAFQIGWPDAEAYGVAVARNIHRGEVGCAVVHSHKMPFLQNLKEADLPPFPTTANYDAKAWATFTDLKIPGSIFINVGSDEHIERNLASVDVDKIDSYREWGDMRDTLF